MTPPFSFVLLLMESLLTQAVSYFAVVGLLYGVVWRWGRERFRRSRIPSPRRVDASQIRREVGHTLVVLVANLVSAGTLLALHAANKTAIVDSGTTPGNILMWTFVGLAFNDAWFYGWHRLLHHPRLFRHIHAVHHRSIDVNPFTSYSFHAIEGILLGIWIIPASLFLPIPMASIGVLQVIGLFNNVMSHLGYEFLPLWILRIPLLRWTNTATFHSLHHTRFNGNFGLHTRLWDRLFGTELPEYERVFVERGNSTRPHASREVSS